VNRYIALFLSTLFHPVFINLASLILLIQLNPYTEAGLSYDAKLFYVFYVFITTAIVPLLWILARTVFGYTKNIMLPEADDRYVPYIVTASAYLFGYYFFLQIGAPQNISAYMLASSAVVILLLVINFKTKISAHAASLGAICGVMMCSQKYSDMDFRLLLIAALLISGLVGVSRLALNAHTHKQLYLGFAVGLFTMLFVLL
jgi:hypothetical protein